MTTTNLMVATRRNLKHRVRARRGLPTWDRTPPVTSQADGKSKKTQQGTAGTPNKVGANMFRYEQMAMDRLEALGCLVRSVPGRAKQRKTFNAQVGSAIEVVQRLMDEMGQIIERLDMPEEAQDERTRLLANHQRLSAVLAEVRPDHLTETEVDAEAKRTALLVQATAAEEVEGDGLNDLEGDGPDEVEVVCQVLSRITSVEFLRGLLQASLGSVREAVQRWGLRKPGYWTPTPATGPKQITVVALLVIGTCGDPCQDCPLTCPARQAEMVGDDQMSGDPTGVQD
jgi:hypothetical protein